MPRERKRGEPVQLLRKEMAASITGEHRGRRVNEPWSPIKKGGKNRRTAIQNAEKLLKKEKRIQALIGKEKKKRTVTGVLAGLAAKRKSRRQGKRSEKRNYRSQLDLKGAEEQPQGEERTLGPPKKNRHLVSKKSPADCGTRRKRICAP